MDPGPEPTPDRETPAAPVSGAPSAQRWRALAVACGVIAVVVTTILVVLGGSAEEPRAAAVLVNTVPRPVLAAIVESIAKLEAALAPPPGSGSEQIEVCGIGWVGVKADGAVEAAALQAAPGLLAARRRLLDSMAAAPDEFSPAVASWLDLYGDASEQARTGVDEMRTRVATRRDALARRASTATDPRVYALAFQTCSRAPEQGACAMLSAARWAQLDAGNAMPWLFMLDEATRRNDEAAVADALFHIASAQRFEDRQFAAFGAIHAHIGSLDIDLPAALGVSVEAISMAAAQSMTIQPLVQACRIPAIGDANRRQVCEGVAEVMAERSDSLLLRQVGVAMGRRLGWPEQRTDAMTGELREWTQSQSASIESFSDSCSGLTKLLAGFDRQASLGEVGVMHDWAATTGRSRESFALAGRNARLSSEAQQASAVLAATATSAAVAASGATSASSSPPR